MHAKIYLDNNATTILAPEAFEAMSQELNAPPSNPSSVHEYGRMAKSRLAKARSSIASYLKAKPTEIVFTSGGTESMNGLIKGYCELVKPGHIITSNIEHSCVQKSLEKLEEKGWRVSYLSASMNGCVSPNQVELAIEPNTHLIVLSAANSETGVKHDIEKIAQIAEKQKIGFIVDAVALLGKSPLTIPKGVTAMGFSAHKFHGPKGIGFCYVKSPTKIKPIIFGGEQEFTLRSGTENLAGIIGLAKAIELIYESPPFNEMKRLRDYFENELKINSGPLVINGEGERVCNVSNLYFPGIDGETLLIQLDMHGVLASQGSACASGSVEPSKVLLGMGLGTDRAKNSLRFSFSRYTTKENIDRALKIIIALIRQMREFS